MARKASTSAAEASTIRVKTTLSPAPPESQIPSVLRFPLVVILSWSLSALLLSLTSEFTAGDLAAVSKRLDTWPEISVIVGWRVVELGISWVLGYDAEDVAALVLLTHYPPISLLAKFYLIRPSTSLSSLLIDTISLYLPFRMLRPLAPSHTSHPTKNTVSNRSITSDLATTISTWLLASGIYAVVLYVAYSTYLPKFLVIHFDGIRDVSATHQGPTVLPGLLLALAPAGWAAREFLFVSSTSSSRTPSASTAENTPFNPETATLGETFYYNIWGWYSQREKVLLSRTAVLVIMMVLNSLVQIVGTVKGVEVTGAAGWSGLWAGASVVTALTYWWVAAVDGV